MGEKLVGERLTTLRSKLKVRMNYECFQADMDGRIFLLI